MGLLSRVTGKSARLAKNYDLLRKCFVTSGTGRRSYLSDAYGCNKEWMERKKDPLLSSVDVEQFFVDLSRKFSAKSKASFAVDVDIYVNSIQNEDSLHELDNALLRLRRSRNTIHTLPSTGAAAVRFLLSHDLKEDLIRVVEDRYNYGIFLDIYTMNYLMDNFLKENNHRDAAKIATQFMLQEDEGNQISKILSLISCTKYLADTKPSAWRESPVVEEEDDDEIEYVRVPNLTNPFFDDHFDLTQANDQVGKTLTFFSKFVPDGVVKNTAMVVGLCRRAKWEELKVKLDAGLGGKDKALSSDVVDLCFREAVSEVAKVETGAEDGEEKAEEAAEREQVKNEDTRPEWVVGAIAKTMKVEQSLLSILEAEAKNLSTREAEDIEAQKKMFSEWQQLRHKAIADQEKAADRDRRIEAIRQKKRELGEKEELIYVFENWNKIEMLLSEVEKEEAGKEIAQQEYVPPTVGRKHVFQQ